MANGYLLGKPALDQVAKLIREDRARYANPTGHRGRYIDTGGGTPCPNRYVFEHLGNPTGGSSTVELYGTYNGVALAAAMTAVIPWDATDTEIKTLLETANGYDPDADPVTGFAVTVVGGPLPNNDITITLPAGVRLRTITAEDALTPTSILRYSRVRSCCGG